MDYGCKLLDERTDPGDGEPCERLELHREAVCALLYPAQQLCNGSLDVHALEES